MNASYHRDGGRFGNIAAWGWYSVALNIILLVLNYVIARLSGSLSVGAEMIHNLVDFITAVVVLVGIHLSTRKTETFPYGLHKVENVISIFIAGMIFLTAYELSRRALFPNTMNTTVHADLWMSISLAVALIITLVFSSLESKAGRKYNSPALIADAKEYRVHGVTTGIALLALQDPGWSFPMDRVGALIIVIAILKTGWDLLVDGMRVLLDASLDSETIQRIRDIIDSNPKVAEVREVIGRNAGRYRFVEVKIALLVENLEETEEVSEQIQSRVRDEIFNVERVLIHPEPVRKTHLTCAAPMMNHQGYLSEHFGESPYFGLVKIHRKDHSVESWEILSNPYEQEERGKGIDVAEWLIKQNVDVVVMKQKPHGKGPDYVFQNADVRRELTNEETLTAVIENIILRDREQKEDTAN